MTNILFKQINILITLTLNNGNPFTDYIFNRLL